MESDITKRDDTKRDDTKRVEKPWGYEEWWAITDKYIGKLLFIKNGHRLSLQYHNIKEESMRVIQGVLTFRHGENVRVMKPGDNVHVLPGTIHRMEAMDGDVIVVEVSTPEVDDVVRIEDDYSRAASITL